MQSYVRTLLDVQRRFGTLHDHDYPLYRAVWVSKTAQGNGLNKAARSSASQAAAEDFKVGRILEEDALDLRLAV